MTVGSRAGESRPCNSMSHRDIVYQMPRKVELGDRPMKVPIALPESLYEWLRRSAFDRRVPMAEIVREALVAYQRKAPRPGEPSGARR